MRVGAFLHGIFTIALASALLAGGTTAAAAAPARTADVWQPSPGTSWQWQIVGEVAPPYRSVQMYDVDLQDAVPSRQRVSVRGFGTVTWEKGDNAGVVAGLHGAGMTVVCYLDSGAWESYRPDADLFPRRVIGHTTGWRGERWLDLRPRGTRAFEPIIWARLRLASRIGCDGVEPDQNNPWGNHPGFPITKAHEKRWYLRVAAHAHRLGLSVGMKNGVEVIDADTVAAFDWALDEECFFFHECGRLGGFVDAGKAVFQTEYVADWRRRGLDTAGQVADQVCTEARQRGFSTLVKRRVPDARFVAC